MINSNILKESLSATFKEQQNKKVMDSTNIRIRDKTICLLKVTCSFLNQDEDFLSKCQLDDIHISLPLTTVATTTTTKDLLEMKQNELFKSK